METSLNLEYMYVKCQHDMYVDERNVHHRLGLRELTLDLWYKSRLFIGLCFSV